MENWYLTGEEGLSFPDIQNFLSWIDPNDHVIDIEIHSCGGDAVEGYAIYDALRASGKQISCTAVGRCASMATVILLAAAKERRFAYPHAKFLIHKPYMASYDGDLDLETLESIKSNLESEKNKMLALYVERTGSEASVIEAQMNKAGWFGGETAKQLGFITTVLMPTTAKGRTYTFNNKKMNKEKKQVVTPDNLKEIAVMTIAVGIIAAAVYFFLIPSQTSISSVSALAIIIAHYVPLHVSTVTMILNVVLLLIGFITCGKEFGAKTVYTSILLPLYLAVFEHVFPDFESLTNSTELDVLCYILVVSFGLSILFNMNASSGGLDIVAKIMNKYLHVELGKAMSISGMCVALSSALIYDKKAVVLSVLGTYFNGIVLDHFIFGQNVKRRVCIITKYEEEVRQFILHELHSGATFYEAMGAYNMQKYREIITIVDKNEYQKLMNYVSKKDPEAFVTVYTVSDMRYRPKVKSF